MKQFHYSPEMKNQNCCDWHAISDYKPYCSIALQPPPEFITCIALFSVN